MIGSGEGDGDVAPCRVGARNQRPRCAVYPPRCGGPRRALRREDPAVLHRLQLRQPAVLVDPEQKSPLAASPPSGDTSCGATHRSGASARMRTAFGGSPRCSSQSFTAVATWRPSSAAPSAVSTGCSRLPTANTPGLLVRRPASTTGPRVAGSIARPAVRASSWSGIQSPVNTTVSHVDVARSIRCRCSPPQRCEPGPCRGCRRPGCGSTPARPSATGPGARNAA